LEDLVRRSLQLVLRDISPSAAVEAYIRERAARLEQFHRGILSCRVVVEAPVRHHRTGGPFTVRIVLKVPGGELVVDRQIGSDLYVVIRDAFDAARRRLEDYARRRRGAVKTHEAGLWARVAKLFPEEGHGFLETRSGREIYFHRNSVLNPGFERLEVGSDVRFVEERGEQGPQASTVKIVSRGRGKTGASDRRSEGSPVDAWLGGSRAPASHAAMPARHRAGGRRGT
jgi:cold shock CspA family protein/ribosome-associated translation inhibitor RaiA